MAFSCFQWIVGGWSQQLTAGDQKHAPEGEVSAETCVESWISTDAAGWSQQLTTGDQKHAPEGEVSAETCVESWISTDAAGWSQQLTTGDQKHAPEVETAEPKLKVLPTLNLPVLDGPGYKEYLKEKCKAVELPDYVPILPRSQDDEKWPLVTKVEVLKKWEGEVSAETCVESWISTDAAGSSQQLTTGDQKHAPEVETAEPKSKVLPMLNLPVLDGPGESPSETKTAPEGDDGDVKADKADKADKVTKNTSKRNARLPLMVQAVELPDYVPILPRSQDDEKWPLVTKVEVLKKWEAPKRPPKPMPQIVTGRRQDRRFYGKALKRVPRWDPRPADYASLPEGMLLVFSQDGRRAIGQQPPDRCNAIPAIPLVYRVHHPIAAQSSWQVQISQPPGLRMVAVPAVPA
ncbi:unnamed protein product [Cladocopium goreaui]|uniref:Uncharacterized protein n=1 Tax=Cladocopium goreaui TaxID=2562237 RepID=A0A9P1DHC6_9DINO|nr:unnamed protein product [Cladocopium goreaui]